MRCRSALTRIDALRTGELDRSEHAAVEGHLESCRSCNASVGDVGGLAKAMKALAVQPPRSCRETLILTDSFDHVGDYWVAFSEKGIRLIGRGSFEEFRGEYARRWKRELQRRDIPASLRRELDAALAGVGVARPHVDFEGATELERDVLGTLERIPRGEVRTYSWVARQIGRERAVRAVANVIARNFAPLVVPCHRVVPSTGGVGEYIFGSRRKRDLLEREGVDVQALDALARRGVRYIGSKTTNIFCFPTCRDARRIREENRVPFRGAEEAAGKGFRPCKRCQPAA